MDFHSYTTMRDWTRRADPDDRPAQDIDRFYRRAAADAQKMGSGQFFGQMLNERDWEKARRPYYNMWPSIIPMLTRLNLDLDSDLIQLPLPALCIRFPKDPAKNPLKFEWKGDEVAACCIMLGEINEGTHCDIVRRCHDYKESSGQTSFFGAGRQGDHGHAKKRASFSVNGNWMLRFRKYRHSTMYRSGKIS